VVDAPQSKQETIYFDSTIPLKVIHFPHSLTWLVLWGWNLGLLGSWRRSKQTSVKITSPRIDITEGMVGTKMQGVEYYRIQNSSYSQGLIQKIFGIGTITVLWRDDTTHELVFHIDEPAKYREIIRGHHRDDRVDMGVREL
jgi:membrane protein YdbS with pleckstrin-like domain